jgi:ferredoxin-NADP reductase
MINSSEPSQEERARMEQQAQRWVTEGKAMLKEGAAALTRATRESDINAMREASELIREGQNILDSGEATYQTLKQGTPPNKIALEWFKSQLNLNTPQVINPPTRILGMVPFQFFICLLMLASIGLALIIYLQRMRRAYQLLERLEAGEGLSLGPNQASSAQASIITPPHQGLLPVERKKLCKLRLSRRFPETPDVTTFRFMSCDHGPIPFSYLPGQFMTLTLPTEGKPTKRSYTISSSPTQGYYCEISVKREEFGTGSRFLHDVLQEGDTLDVRGPSGKLIFTGKEADSIILIGGGVGITPMMSVARALADMGWKGEIIFIVCCNDPDHFIFGAELERLKGRNANLNIFVAMSKLTEEDISSQIHASEKPSDQLYYQSGRLTKEHLLEWVPDIASRPRIHLCASPPLMAAIEQMLADLGVPAESLKTESFGSQEKPHSREETHSSVIADNAATVEFKLSGKSTIIEGDETILEAGERLGIDLAYSCRVGGCGECSVKVISGEVEMETEDALEASDKAANIILACQARPTSNVVIEA